MLVLRTVRRRKRRPEATVAIVLVAVIVFSVASLAGTLYCAADHNCLHWLLKEGHAS